MKKMEKKHEKPRKGKKYMKKWKKSWKNEKNYEQPIWELSFRQLVFRKCLSGFVHFGKKYIWEISIWGHTFEVLTVNPSNWEYQSALYVMQDEESKDSLVQNMWSRKGDLGAHSIWMLGVGKDKDADFRVCQDGSGTNKKGEAEQYRGLQ